MAPKPNQTTKTTVILEILNRIPVTNRLVTLDEIIRSLSEAGIVLKKRTAQRYLSEMSEEVKYGIVRDTRDTAYGYRRVREDCKFNQLKLAPNECLLLRLAQEYMKFQMPSAIVKSLDFVFDEAERMLNERSRNTKEREWLKKVCVVSSSIPQLPAKILPRIFDEVSEALYLERKLSIEYVNSEGKEVKAFVSPLGLVQQDVRLYLVCQFDGYDDFRHLPLHRLKNAKLTATPLIRPKGFELKEYIQQRHFNYSNGEWVRWILEFTSDVTALNLQETPFNHSQTLVKKEDGIWHLEVDIQNSPLLDAWIAMWKEPAGILVNNRIPIEADN